MCTGTKAFYCELDIVKYNLKRKKQSIKHTNNNIWNQMGFKHLPPPSRSTTCCDVVAIC